MINGLDIPWPHDKQIYVNPEFNKLKYWCEKIYYEVITGARVYLLMPARTDTKYFHEWILPIMKSIDFYKGRICFDDSGKGSTFPTLGIECEKTNVRS